MKKLYVEILLLITLTSSINYAQSNGFGLGVILGSPTGISVKYWTSENNAFDFGLGYSFEKNSRTHLHFDYLFHVKNLFQTNENIQFFYGPGARLKMVKYGDSRLSFRFDIGLVWIPQRAPIDVFVEIAPLLDIIPATDFNFNGGIGVRYYFN